MITVKNMVEFCKKVDIFFKYIHSHEFHDKIFFKLQLFYLSHGVEIPSLNEELTKHRVSCCACPINFEVDLLSWAALFLSIQLLFSLIFLCMSNLQFVYFYFLISLFINGIFFITNFIYVSTMVLGKPSDTEKDIFYREDK